MNRMNETNFLRRPKTCQNCGDEAMTTLQNGKFMKGYCAHCLKPFCESCWESHDVQECNFYNYKLDITYSHVGKA